LPSTAALITALIMERPLCIDCIASRTNTSRREVVSYIRKIAEALTVQRGQNDRCRACGAQGKTYSLVRVD
jgi:hypothetical protein